MSAYHSHDEGSALKRAGVDDVQELLTSPRDNQPYVILYGKQALPLLDRGVVAYEQNGKDGASWDSG